jgi:hypothetical protein
MTQTYKCTKCEEEKLFSEFHKQSRAKNGIREVCKICRKEEGIKRYKSNKDHILKQQQNKKEEIKLYRKEYNQKNKEKHKVDNKNWRENNKERKREMDKEYQSRPEVKSRVNERTKERYKTDLLFRLNFTLSNRIRQTLKDGKNSRSWKDIVEYNEHELKEHLELRLVGGMTWENYLNGDIHLDHIRPIESFNMETIEEFRECWSLNNLQFLWAVDNIKKLDKWDKTLENVSFNLKYVTLAELRENLKRF